LAAGEVEEIKVKEGMSSSTPFDKPHLWVIAGPNGVGKTTYAFRHIRAVSGSNVFVNLDEIARGLFPLDPQGGQRRAGRVALDMMHSLVKERKTFSIETTLSGRTHLQTLHMALKAGYNATLLYFIVTNPEICLSRIKRRVSEGGHNVAEADVRRRFERSLSNFSDYSSLCNVWRVFDNYSGPHVHSQPHVVAEGSHGCISLKDDLGHIPEKLQSFLMGLPPCSEG
jgi:predicted ABC-type ATPase